MLDCFLDEDNIGQSDVSDGGFYIEDCEYEEETEEGVKKEEKDEQSKRKKINFSEASDESVLKKKELSDADEHNVPQEGWRISFYKRAFPVKKYEAGYPDAAKKVYMEKRRPLWLPQYGIDEDYFMQASYFSEVLARDQLKRQAVFRKIYKPNFGEYAYCRSDLIGRTYISKYMKGVHCCKFSPDGKYLVIGCGNGTIQIRNLNSKRTSVHCTRGYNRRITSVKFLPVGREDYDIFFASSLTGRVFMGRLEDSGWRCYAFLKEIRNEINAMDLNTDGSRMVTAGADSHIRIYDPKEKKLLHIYLRPGTINEEGKVSIDRVPEDGHYRRICALKFVPDDLNVYVTGGWDDIVKVWDLRTVTPVQSIAGPHLMTNSIDVWGRIVLTGQWTCNDSIQLWDMRYAKCLNTVQPLNRPICYAGEFINSVQYIHSWEGPDITIPGAIGDLILAVGSGTRALEVISIKENMILHSTEEANAVMTVDHFRSLIAYGGVSHVYGIVSFFPFVGTLSTDMKFPDKETEDEMIKNFSGYGNPMGWHEVALGKDFMEAFDNPNEQNNELENRSEETKEIKKEEQLEKNVLTYTINVPQ